MTAFAWGAATDVGRVRAANQDRHHTDDTLFAVADGMGGHTGGEIAARIAVEVLADRGSIESVSQLVDLAHRANDAIVEAGRADPSLRGMGTTLAALAKLTPEEGDPRLGVVNVGDSRVYTLDGHRLEQITEDHSLVEALVRDGRLSRADATGHPQRNILTRALGIDEKVLVDAWELRARRGDRFLVASDGLFNELTEAEIVDLLGEIEDPTAAANALVEHACEAGGRDNVTAVVVHVLEGTADPDADRLIGVRRALPAGAEVHPAVEEDPDAADVPDDPLAAFEEPSAPATAVPFLTWRLGALVAAVIVVLAVLFTSIAAYARAPYFVGVDGAEVVIFQGHPGGVLWFEPTVEEPINLGLAELSDDDATAVTDGVTFDDIDEAREFGRLLILRSRDTG